MHNLFWMIDDCKADGGIIFLTERPNLLLPPYSADITTRIKSRLMIYWSTDLLIYWSADLPATCTSSKVGSVYKSMTPKATSGLVMANLVKKRFWTLWKEQAQKSKLLLGINCVSSQVNCLFTEVYTRFLSFQEPRLVIIGYRKLSGV